MEIGQTRGSAPGAPASFVIGLIAAAILAGAALPAAQSPEERAVARDVIRRKADAVVMVTATLRIRANVGGQEQIVDQQAQGNGTIIDASGLTVLSLSTLQPDEMMARSLSARMRQDTRVDVSSEPSSIRIHLAGGREMPARLVLRDPDLDLAFIKPTEPAPSITWIDAPAAKVSLLDLVFVIHRTSEANGWLTGASFATVQLILDKPRLYYQLAAAGGSAPLGAPVFDAAGRFVGVVVLRTSGSRGPSATGVLPAEEIRDVAKQAM